MHYLKCFRGHVDGAKIFFQGCNSFRCVYDLCTIKQEACCQTEHPLYAAGGTASVLAPSMATRARDYRQQPVHVSEVDGEVVALHRQNQVRQLKDTCLIDGLCIYNYQLATQVDRIDKFIHLSQNLIASPACD
jgi:hypothetical protein